VLSWSKALDYAVLFVDDNVQTLSTSNRLAPKALLAYSGCGRRGRHPLQSATGALAGISGLAAAVNTVNGLVNGNSELTPEGTVPVC
jgi:hypothetical protein